MRWSREVLKVDPFFLGAPGYPLDLQVLGASDTLEYEALAELRGTHPAANARRIVLSREFDAGLGGLDSAWLATTPTLNGCWRTRSGRFLVGQLATDER